jgi:hypothetical protein
MKFLVDECNVIEGKQEESIHVVHMCSAAKEVQGPL